MARAVVNNSVGHDEPLRPNATENDAQARQKVLDELDRSCLRPYLRTMALTGHARIWNDFLITSLTRHRRRSCDGMGHSQRQDRSHVEESHPNASKNNTELRPKDLDENDPPDR
ncbi:hypothetical protein WN48_10223 [Eufriesea mexicana]|nr:hypothetical protein WN48_10223 [Eufriesea mexicana]